MKFKNCRSCKEKRSIEHFGILNKSSDGHRSECKECRQGETATDWVVVGLENELKKTTFITFTSRFGQHKREQRSQLHNGHRNSNIKRDADEDGIEAFKFKVYKTFPSSTHKSVIKKWVADMKNQLKIEGKELYNK